MCSLIVRAAALAVFAAPLAAQSFNLDYGQPTSPPSSSYGAAGLPGYWNAIEGVTWVDYVLSDRHGNPTSVHFSQSGAAGILTASDPSVAGDDALLLEDGLITYDSSVDSCFYFNGLDSGTYELITYAWRPDDPTLQAKTFVDNTPGLEITGGIWPGHHVHGITFARHIVTVDASGFMGPHSGLAAGANPAVGAVCNGMQLRRLDAYAPFCLGDGSGGACPCGNAGAERHGCENSAGTGGALLTGAGAASLSLDTLELECTGELPSALSVVLQGSASIAPVSYGDGLRCTGGLLKRLYAKSASGGAVSAPQAGDPSISARSAALGDPIPLGGTREYQVYYRDPNASFCPAPPGGTFNVSNAIAATWGP
jgi:hypothetical protein